MDPVELQIRQYLSDNHPAPDDQELAAGDSLFEAGVLDSMGVLGLVTWMEEAFDIIVEDDEVVPENIDGIGCLVRYVEGKRNDAGLGG